MPHPDEGAAAGKADDPAFIEAEECKKKDFRSGPGALWHAGGRQWS